MKNKSFVHFDAVADSIEYKFKKLEHEKKIWTKEKKKLLEKIQELQKESSGKTLSLMYRYCSFYDSPAWTLIEWAY